MSIRHILSVLEILRPVLRLPPPAADHAGYDEAVAALRALKSLFEQELARRGGGQQSVGRIGDDDAV